MPPANKIDKTKRTPPRKKASAKKHRRRKRPVPYRIAFLRWHDPDQVQGSGAGPSRLRRAPLEFYPYSVCFCRENDSTNPRGCQCRAKGAGGKPQTPCFGSLCRGRFYIGPVCGGANARGRDKSRPYDRRRACSRPENSGPRVITNLCRGRCLHRPGGPRRAANARGRDKSRPYGRRRACSQPGKPWPRVITNLCRGRCLHRPGGPRRAANARGRDKSRPYGRRRVCSQPGKQRAPRYNKPL